MIIINQAKIMLKRLGS